MIPVPAGVRVWLATSHTDEGFLRLSLQVQEVLRRDPLSGHLLAMLYLTNQNQFSILS